MTELDPNLDELIRRLNAERPLPRPEFRGTLGRTLRAHSGTRPQHQIKLAITLYATAGVLLLGIACASLANVGPLA